MKVVILAGGYANRLRSVTNNGEIPKTLLPISINNESKPILFYLLEKIEKLPNVDEIIVIVNDKYIDSIKEAVNVYSPNVDVSIYSDGSHSPETALGANVAVQLANENISKSYAGDIMIMASDNYFEFPLSDVVNYYENLKDKYGDNINLVVSKKYPDSEREFIANNFGILNIDSDNRIISFDEKPGIENLKSNNASLALYMFNRRDLDKIDEYMDSATGKARDSLGHFINYMINNTETYTYPITGIFYDIGTPDEYLRLAPKSEENKLDNNI